MLKTNNPVMESLLDATLRGDDRRLYLVGAADKDAIMILFTPDGIATLERQLANAQRRTTNIELALALSRVGLTLGVKVED